MFQLDFNHPLRVHFIGIGGISMSGLAEILLDRGFAVSGSDNVPSALTDRLAERGAVILTPQAADNVSADIDLVVYTAAIHPDNPEFAACVKLGLPLLTRAELLGQIMAHYARSIAVAGTHGKTTTTGMVGEILLHGEAEPTISIGGIYPAIGGNIHVGDSDLFVTEACEYTNSFHEFYPRFSIILNIEEDHMDFFKDLDDIRRSFRRFAENTADDGVLIINRGIARLGEITDGLACRVVTFGADASADYFAADVEHLADGRTSFVPMERVGVADADGGVDGRVDAVSTGDGSGAVLSGGGADGRVDAVSTVDGSGGGADGFRALAPVVLRVPGAHNILNALAAIALARAMGLPMAQTAAALSDFRGTDRRFQRKGVFQGAVVYDDYAHHPTEIAASLAAARDLPHERLIVVFQPHTYTRTKAFLQEFADVLAEADVLVLCKIYEAREDDIYGVSSADIKRLVDAKHLPGVGGLEKCYYYETFDEVEAFLKKNSSTGDLLITMGAGDVVKIGERLLAR